VVVERNLITKTEGGLALTEDKWRVDWWGRVVAVGPGMLRTMPDRPQPGAVQPMLRDCPQDIDRYPMQCKIGDIVLCPAGMQPIPEEMKHTNPNTRLFYSSERQLVAILHIEDGDTALTIKESETK
jgi:hypothetical protein